ncbi:hypothetical protein ACSU64_23095 [Bacillaceae bacterium C204]|uniref:hypothetical protein n=1 Tax=Neobacillus sp. 204 TaxID=3383351 RepID=UPI0039797762
MKVLLELVRIVFLVVLIGGILSAFINYVYSKLETDIDTYGWMGLVSILIFLFVQYRNKYQFSGWYTGKGRVKLPTNVSKVLITISILLMLLPLILSFFLT